MKLANLCTPYGYVHCICEFLHFVSNYAVFSLSLHSFVNFLFAVVVVVKTFQLFNCRCCTLSFSTLQLFNCSTIQLSFCHAEHVEASRRFRFVCHSRMFLSGISLLLFVVVVAVAVHCTLYIVHYDVVPFW